MRITTPKTLLAKTLAVKATKKLPITLASLLLLTGGVLLLQNLSNPDKAMAITPPDSCFAFNASTGAITDYYDNQANNPANPACPRDVDIPTTIGGVAVTGIAQQAFNFKYLTSVTIPDSVVSIGANAFYYNKLTSVTIPDSVTTIGNSAFGSNELESVTIHESVTTIGGSAFSSNELTSVTIPDSVVSIGHNAFYINKLTSVTIPDSVTTIGNSAFGSNELESVTIPESVTSIGNWAFASNQLNSVTIANSSAAMGHYSFTNNPIESMKIGDDLYTPQSPTTDTNCFATSGTTLNNYLANSPIVARDNGVLCGREVAIPDSITTIAWYAFDSTSIRSVTIPDSVTSIGEYAFSYNQLTSVDIPDSVSNIDASAFQNNRISTATIGDGVTTIPASVFSHQFDPSKWDGNADDWYDAIANGDLSDFSRAYSAAMLTKIYTKSPSNPNNLKSSLYIESYTESTGDGSWDDNTLLGGYIVNPGSISLSYRNTDGQSILSSNKIAGIDNTTGDPITNYYLSSVPEFTTPVDTSWPSPIPTPEEQQSIDAALSSYYHIGDEVTVTPPAVSGYVTPAAKTFTLSGGSNNGEFVYKKKLVKVDFSKPAGSTDNPATNSASASTLDDSLANSTFRVDTAAQCSNIDEARLLPASGFAAPIEGYTTLGGIDFTISCANPGGDTKVNLDLSTKMTNQSSIKIYKRTASKTIDITDKVTIADVNGKTSIAYSLTDGGELDDDGLVNGVIVDPIYITVPSEDGILADTGVDSVVVLVAGVALVISGSVVLSHVYRRRMV